MIMFGVMEIKDPIHGALPFNEAELPVLDTPVFQRLRMIKQLGFAEYSFPGATHSRYIHSLGVTYLAGKAFDQIFKEFEFSSLKVKERLRQTLRLAALLHDIGHGPLSHTTEEAMPRVKELNISAYKNRVLPANPQTTLINDDEENRIANHEDYTIKFITDSHLTKVLKSSFPDIEPIHIACLIDKTIKVPDNFFIDQGLNFRTLLAQLVSSEIDVDRMDYLERDAYFCGTNYGKVETEWLMGNFSYHIEDKEVYLALDRRALYTFDDFLISRHHMYLMIYFHHKSIIYEELLYRYLTSDDCKYSLPSDIEEYVKCTDYSLYQHLAESNNPWAKRITQKDLFKVLFEQHITEDSPRLKNLISILEENGIETISASSKARLSKYHMSTATDKTLQIYVIDSHYKDQPPITIDKCTEIFEKYEQTRKIERIYVPAGDMVKARDILSKLK